MKTFELRASAVQALGFGRRGTGPALETLAACYTTTQLLIHRTTRTELSERDTQTALSDDRRYLFENLYARWVPGNAAR